MSVVDEVLVQAELAAVVGWALRLPSSSLRYLIGRALDELAERCQHDLEMIDRRADYVKRRAT
jgi:hypothetical protein